MKVLHFILTVGTVLAAVSGFCQSGISIVVPNDLQTVDGDSGSHWPWASGPMRYQQVFGASQFQQVAGAGGGWVKGFEVRLDGHDIGSFGRAITNVEIRLSTTARDPDALSDIFNENIGPDEKLVRTNDVSLLMIRENLPPELAQPFYGVIATDPFFYNPNLGNLLMDIRIFSESPIFLPSDLDSSRVLGDSVSRVVGAINSQSGFTVDTDGLVTRFFVEAIPEPSVLSLFVAGIGGGLLVRCWRRRR